MLALFFFYFAQLVVVFVLDQGQLARFAVPSDLKSVGLFSNSAQVFCKHIVIEKVNSTLGFHIFGVLGSQHIVAFLLDWIQRFDVLLHLLVLRFSSYYWLV